MSWVAEQLPAFQKEFYSTRLDILIHMKQLSTRRMQKYDRHHHHHHHHVLCLTTYSYSLPQKVLQTVQSNSSSLKVQFFPVPLRSSRSCLLLPRLLVASTFSLIFYSLKYFIRQFLPEMWPGKLDFFLFAVWRMLVSSITVWNTS